MVGRLEKFKQSESDKKIKQFTLRMPLSVWEAFKDYSDSLNLNGGTNEAIVKLIELELDEAGFTTSKPKKKRAKRAKKKSEKESEAFFNIEVNDEI